MNFQVFQSQLYFLVLLRRVLLKHPMHRNYTLHIDDTTLSLFFREDNFDTFNEDHSLTRLNLMCLLEFIDSLLLVLEV